MLTILFKILSVLGILLLILLGIAIVVILLILFFPVCYKMSGRKSAEELCLRARVKWLFGLLRVSYDYPDPGRILVKLLFFTLYDSETSGSRNRTKNHPSRPASGDAAEMHPEIPQPDVSEDAPASGQLSEAEETQETQPGKDVSDKAPDRLYGFFERIRYTVRKICDKIKNILQNITFYKELWKDPDTQGLLKHAGKRLGHIFRRLRPKKLTVTAVAGTGSPDTTGYLYGIYGMLLPKIGKGICITPDFEQAILEGDFKASGHFTVACVLFHSLRLVLDRRLRQLINRIRQYQKNQKK